MSRGRKPKPKVEVESQITDSVTTTNPSFMMDISEFGVKFDEAEKFVKTAIRFYFDNKDKNFDIQAVQQVIEPASNDKFSEVLDKVKRFENQIKMNNYIPKRTVVDFLNDLKK
jgi:hypothetical protein